MSGARWIIAALGLLAVAAGVFWSRSSQPSFHLLTAQERLEREAFGEEGQVATRGLNVTRAEGPAISFSSPGQDLLASPVSIDVNIAAKDGVPVDMSSIRIDYRLGPSWVNVTQRIMKYAAVKGTRLYARAAELPAGRHTMRLSVRDNNRRLTQVQVSFVVR